MLIIVADDLTGSVDTAAPFAGRGLRTQILLEIDALDAALSAAPQVLSICLGTRERSADEARQMTQDLFARLPNDADLFKKIDSRLKGNIAAELDATPYQRALVAPAIPEFQRVVRAGHVEGFGVAVPLAVADALGSHAARSNIPDTITAADMDAALAARGPCDLLVGARGLAEALARQMTGRTDMVCPDFPRTPLLFVIGSRDPITVEQAEVLRTAMAINDIRAPNGVADIPDALPHSVTLLQAVAWNEPCSPAEVTANLTQSVMRLDLPPTILLSGGETAGSVLKALQIGCMELVGEALPGIGVARAADRVFLTKSGGFGARDTLLRLSEQ